MSGEKPGGRDAGRPGDRLTGGQVGILLTLMAEARPLPNPELAARFRQSLDGADRRRLNGLGLVDSRRAGRSYVHELTDAGWSRCREELRAPSSGRGAIVPPGAVQALLAALGRHLDLAGLDPRDVFRPAPSSPGPGSPAPVAPARVAATPASPTPADAVAPGEGGLAQ